MLRRQATKRWRVPPLVLLAGVISLLSNHNTSCLAFQSPTHQSSRSMSTPTRKLLSPLTVSPSSSTARHSKFPWDWDGDDLRWSSRASRRFRRSFQTRTSQPGKTLLLTLNTLMFLYQTASTVHAIRRRYPHFWPSQSGTIILDALLGASIVPGDLTVAFAHSAALSPRQPYRYLTAGFLHGGFLHWILNMDALRRMPSWLETGLGTPLFLTTFLTSIVTGSIFHSSVFQSSAACVGASAGLTGLYGLMYVSLVRMGNPSAATRVLTYMAIILFYGLLLSNVSNGGHLGGFLGGCLVGLLCGPSYQKSYSMRRKGSLEVDDSPREYRSVMGFGTKPSGRGLLPLPVFWALALLGIWSQPSLRAAPLMIVKGLLDPTSVTSML